MNNDSRKNHDKTNKTKANFKKFDGFLQDITKRMNVAGLAMGIVKNGEIIYQGNAGFRDLDKKLPVTSDTLFAIGSTTKAFTATVLGILSDRGIIDLDKPVRTYIPWFELKDPAATQMMTPRDLLTHRSGLPRHDLVWYNNRINTREEIVRRLKYLDFSAGFREKFQYNNLMFLTAGFLIEFVTGKSWEENVRELIFKPLGMTRSNFSVYDSQKDNDHARPYREDEKKLLSIPFRPIDQTGPAGAINSSVNEICKWIQFNLAGGAVNGKHLLSSSIINDITTPQMTIGMIPEKKEFTSPSYGLGWMVDTYRGKLRVHHSGGIDGFITELELFPHDNAGIIVFCNSETNLPAIAARHAIDTLFDLEPVDWAGDALSRKKLGQTAVEKAKTRKNETRRAGTAPAHNLDEYTGTYEHPGYGILEIKLVDDRLVAIFNEIETPLEHWHYEIFNGTKNIQDPTFENMRYHFDTNQDGWISQVKVQMQASVPSIVFSKKANPKLSDPDYLGRLAGDYKIAGQEFQVELSGHNLKALFPGTPPLKLVPGISGIFNFEGNDAEGLKFILDETGQLSAVQLIQATGVFEVEILQQGDQSLESL